MKAKKMITALMTVCLILPLVALAKPDVKINVVAEKEISKMENGKTVKKRVVADKVEPNQTIIFTVYYSNNGDEKATSVVVKNPIPKGAEYVTDSAKGKGSKISFSIDGGKTFKKPSLLTYQFKQQGGAASKRKASPDQYTHIRWIIDEIPAGASGTLSYQAMIK